MPREFYLSNQILPREIDDATNFKKYINFKAAVRRCLAAFAQEIIDRLPFSTTFSFLRSHS
jgi:hypothetical protein